MNITKQTLGFACKNLRIFFGYETMKPEFKAFDSINTLYETFVSASMESLNPSETAVLLLKITQSKNAVYHLYEYMYT